MRILKYLMLILIIPGLAVADGTWNNAYQGTDAVHSAPVDATNASAIDDHMRNTRNAVGNRAEVEHHWGFEDGTNDDNGLHRLGSARCYMQNEPPTSLNNSNTNAANIADYEITGATGVSDLNDASSQSAAAAEDDLGHGRCWIDTNDNNRMYIYVGIAADDTPSTIADGWIPASSLGTNNLVLHGTFTGVDGDGDPTSTTIPYGWILNDTATFDYLAADSGTGVSLEITAGATDSGVDQLFGGLRKSTWYRFSALVKSPDNSSACSILVSGGDSSFTPDGSISSTTSSTIKTLTLLVKTNSTPSDLTLTLNTVTDTKVCVFDDVSVERLSGPASTGAIAFVVRTIGDTFCTSSYGGGCDKLASIEVTPPGPGYIISIRATVNVTVTASHTCRFELFDEDATAQLDEVRAFDNGHDWTDQVTLSYLSIVPLVAGVTVEYTVNGIIPTSDTACEANDDLSLYTTKIEALLIPAGR